MRWTGFIGFLLMSSMALTQTTLIPDTTFEQALIDQGIDSDGIVNGQVLTSDIENLTELDVSGLWTINELTGIEDFTSLEQLVFYMNNVSQLDVSSLSSLKYLDCSNNSLSQLDLTQNTALEVLFCGNDSFDTSPFNTFTSLDLSANINLTLLYCDFAYDLETLTLGNNVNLELVRASNCNLNTLNTSGLPNLREIRLGEYIPSFSSNSISLLDFSMNSQLETVIINEIMLTALNVKNGNNGNTMTMNALGNPNLLCITVDDEVAATNGDYPYDAWDVDPQINYSENCVLGLEEYQWSIEISPNPVLEWVRVQSDIEITKFELYDVFGKRLLQQKGVDLRGISLSKLSSGIYFFTVYSEKKSQVKRILKQ